MNNQMIFIEGNILITYPKSKIKELVYKKAIKNKIFPREIDRYITQEKLRARSVAFLTPFLKEEEKEPFLTMLAPNIINITLMRWGNITEHQPMLETPLEALFQLVDLEYHPFVSVIDIEENNLEAEEMGSVYTAISIRPKQAYLDVIASITDRLDESIHSNLDEMRRKCPIILIPNKPETIINETIKTSYGLISDIASYVYLGERCHDIECASMEKLTAWFDWELISPVIEIAK